VMQVIMLAASEANFFASAPVIAHQIVRAGATQPIDMLVGGFTLTGVSLLMSERFQIPVVNYCLQPTCIPSTDANWQSVVPIESHTVLTFLDTLEERYFTGHAALQPLKRMMESNPFSAVSLPKLRAAYGLQPSDTWTAIMQQKLPVVIPMAPITFERPPGWTERIACTDFIFLRAAPKIGVVAKLSDVVERFCDAAVASGRKLVLMSFSSMPVPRAKMLACATRMVSESSTPLSLLYVGPPQPDTVPRALMNKRDQLVADGTLLEAARADFGVLFKRMDAFVVHGGLGTTVEAMRMKKPVAVTGILLFDQRFWGAVVHQKGIGPPPVHVDLFAEQCVAFVNKALDPASEWCKAAAALDMGAEEDDGVHANVRHFASLIESGRLKPAAAAIK